MFKFIFYTKRLTLLFILTISSSIFAQKQELSPQLFQDSISKNEQIQLLDVRTSNEYNQGHIKGSFQADWNSSDQFKERISSLDKNKPLYVYCLAGSRSTAAQKWLLQEGFVEVVNLRGGINSWNLEELPLEGKKEVPQMTLLELLNLIPTNKIALVDIGAEWCPPCKKMNPIVTELSQEYPVIYIDGGSQTEVVKELHVEAFPTFIVFKNGKELKRITGVCSKEELKKLLE